MSMISPSVTVRSLLSAVMVASIAAAVGCKESAQSSKPEGKKVTPAKATEDPAVGDADALPTPALLLAQAQFAWEEGPDGNRTVKPGPAKLLMLTPAEPTWEVAVLEDEDSRVFHKVICRDRDGVKSLLTIGGTDAHLKTWTRKDGRWQGQSHWKPTFGGKWDRLRDFEIGDVTGDGKDELVIVTHDQGVVVVADATAANYEPQEIFRRQDTFIHEVEIGDVDGDGKREFYVTPSDPNKAGKSQAGGVSMFTAQQDGSYKHEPVVEYPNRHPKEILVTDVDGDGKDELYVSLEAQLEKTDEGTKVKAPLEIVQFTRKSETWVSRVVATLDKGVQARVLLHGDLEGQGKRELVVTTFKDGLWRITPGTGEGAWVTTQIDAESSGFEHAAALLDLDGDKKNELYVAADDQDEVRRYVWNGSTFDKTTLFSLAKSDLTWSIEGCL